MSNILIILIFIVIVAYNIMTQKPKAKQTARPKPDAGLPEPPMEEAGTAVEEEPFHPRQAPVPYTPRTQPQKPKPDAAPEPKHPAERESISLRTRSEARRAFIYSEIFKRKY